MSPILSLAMFGMLSVTFERSEAAGVRANANIQHFTNLCRIYKTALNPPMPSLRIQEHGEELNEVRKVYAALASSDWYKIMSNASNEQQIPEDFKKAFTEYGQGWKSWIETVKELEKNPGEFERLNSEASPVVIARAKMESILKTMQAISKEQAKLRVGEREEEIKRELRTAVLGPSGDEDTPFGKPPALKVVRVDSCGAARFTTHGSLAGDNLGIDIMCICAAENANEHKKDACGPGVGGGGANSATQVWSSGQATGTDLNTLWTTYVKPTCIGEHHPPAKSTQEARHLLAEFLRNVAIGGECMHTSEMRKRKPGLLGSWYVGSCTVANTGCNGDASSDGGTCVFYGDKRGDQITWYKGVNEALKKLETLQNETRAVEHHTAQIKSLKSRAEEIYAEAQTSLKLEKENPEKPTQSKSQQQNPATATDKSSVQDPSAVNTATLPPFILPWTLLI